jgi:hypothetical protein
MEEHFVPVSLGEIAGAVRHHLGTLPSAIDSFLEEHILASSHYRIVVAGAAAGFTSIHRGSLITQFSLSDPYKRHGQPLFGRVRRLEQVQGALVPTCDEFFLAHALDDYRLLAKQAYFFAAETPLTPAAAWALRPVESGEAGFVRAESGDFFEPIGQRVDAGALYLTTRDDEPVGFGLLARLALYQQVASIGMFTIER